MWTTDPVNELKAERRGDGKSITISWAADVTDQQLLYYLIITSQDTNILLYNFTISMITSNGMIHSVNVSIDIDMIINTVCVVYLANNKFGELECNAHW